MASQARSESAGRYQPCGLRRSRRSRSDGSAIDHDPRAQRRGWSNVHEDVARTLAQSADGLQPANSADRARSSRKRSPRLVSRKKNDCWAYLFPWKCKARRSTLALEIMRGDERMATRQRALEIAPEGSTIRQAREEDAAECGRICP